MKTYKFLFRINHSSVSITYPFNGEVGEYEITMPEDGRETIISIIDLKESFVNTINHLGIRISVVINAQDIDEGSYKAQIRASYIAVVLSFVCNATISDPILELGYETTESAINTEFMQLLYMDGELFKQKRIIDHFWIENLGKTIMEKSSLRIGRAIRWYRKGLNEIDSIDRFMYYWVGLECLNSLLAKEFGAQPKTGECKNCGHKYVIPTVTGIEAIFDKYSKNGKSDYKKCRKLRVELQHGHGDLKDEVEVAHKYAELCREMLLQGLYLLLNINQTIIDRHPAPLYNLNMPRIEFKGFYEISPKDLSTVPYLIIDINDININIEDNKMAITFANRIDSNIPFDMELNSVNFIGEDGVSMKINSIKQTPKNNC